LPSATSICKTILPNGIRILTEQVPYVESSSIGIWANVGSRDEDDSRRGISHFIEHMLFKGTNTRNAWQIADEMDYLGGHLNAFTDKEHTCFYVKVLSEHSDKALDILCDMVLNSVLDQEEMDREKNVVIEEIKRHRDTPEELVHDLIPEVAWRGHRLGNSVIGLEEVILGLTHDDLAQFMQEFYRPDAMVVCAAGNVDHDRFVDLVTARFSNLTGKRTVRQLDDICVAPGRQMLSRATEQVHFCMGTRGYTVSDSRKYALATVDCVLGGGMSSRLFQEIREKRGLAYSVGSYAVSYQDNGMFVVFGGTSRSSLDEVLELVNKECKDIAENSITSAELERARNQIRSSIVLAQESMSNRMSRLAKNEICYGRIFSMEEVIREMTMVTQDDVAQVADSLLKPDAFSLVAVGDFAAEEE